MKRRRRQREVAEACGPQARASCLTEVSASFLVAGAIGFSALLWLAILAVI
ncbi:MAG: hypothetical protein OXE48_02350 [Gammaproteobacteria bacterium]|nr:hypothetical protein [Gammaproteobacteria bacterium]